MNGDASPPPEGVEGFGTKVIGILIVPRTAYHPQGGIGYSSVERNRTALLML